MSWNIDCVSANPKRKKRDHFGQFINKNVDFEHYASQKMQEMKTTLNKEKQDYLTQIDSLKQKADQIKNNPSRGVIRLKIQIENQLKHLIEKMQDITEGKKLLDMKKKLVPYAEAYEREQHIRAMEKIQTICETQTNQLLPKGKEKDRETISVSTSTHSSEVMKEIMENLDNMTAEPKAMPNEICGECDGDEIMMLESRSSMLVCKCGNCRQYLDSTSSHMAYGEEVEFTQFAYMRLNHFNERLTYSQAKESTKINPADIEQIMECLAEKRIMDPEKITMEITYAAAKELKMRHIYKQNTQLWCEITGKPPPRMAPSQEEQLREMFKAINRLWLKYKPEDRKNFLSYNYILYKFCELLGLDHFLPLYKLLKGDKKLEKQDEIFKRLCEDKELMWEFIPSKHD